MYTLAEHACKYSLLHFLRYQYVICTCIVAAEEQQKNCEILVQACSMYEGTENFTCYMQVVCEANTCVRYVAHKQYCNLVYMCRYVC